MATHAARLGADFGPRVRFVSITRRSRDRHAGGAARLRRRARRRSGRLELPHRDAPRRSRDVVPRLRRIRASKNDARRRRPPLPHLAGRPQRACCASSTWATASTRTKCSGTCARCCASEDRRCCAGCPRPSRARRPRSTTKLLVGVPRDRGVAGRRRRGRAWSELGAVNERAEDLVKLQRKIAAYRQIQHDTTAQLYSVASAMLVPDERTLEATLRQLNQFGYDLDRLQFVGAGRDRAPRRVRTDYEAFIAVVTEVVELIRAGKVARGPRGADRARGPAGRPPRAPDQRAGQQGRGRHGGAHRRGAGRLPRRSRNAGHRPSPSAACCSRLRWATRSRGR